MPYEILFKASARKQLGRIQARDRERILARIIALASDPRPEGATKLTNQNAYRVRQGDYRIIYTVRDSILTIEVVRIGHRRDVYDSL
jgi:mRNA interferase RelE/StbE